MKRYGNLFDRSFTPDALYIAYVDARASKRGKRACFAFEKALGANLEALHREIHDGTYRPRSYYTFEVFEPKRRTIHAPAFRDCVVQHAICRVICPIFDRSFIDQSYACRIGKGTHKASDYTQQMLRQCDGDSYVLKLDIRRFFYSIDRGVLRCQIERKIKDHRLVDMMMLFVDAGGEIGIPIGNLLSQVYALIYLNPLDHYVKRDLKVRRYARYVDDFVLIGLSRDECLAHRANIERFLSDELCLSLSKSTISKVKRGVNFVGYRTWRSRRFIRKHSLYRFRRAVKHGDLQAAVSLLGHARRTASMRHMLRLARERNPAIYADFPKQFTQQGWASNG